ncbi:MAG: AVAST type 2 anti-phage system protein Avs2 [Candidatus Helarchaeota archaeon]
MSINWQNLRPWNGSQNAAFEELCCQLASYEKAPQGSIFIRKAPPDAGVECFWKLPNGDEWGWQAKFFLSPPSINQWSQLDESVKKALEKHPRLTSYTICLPIDRQDPRIEEQKWFMDKWNEHVEKWQQWAKEKGISVEFKYWGEHEIWERLSREEHRGRYYFWFNKELFSQQWFENRIEEAVANVGPRYTPELNVELPIARLFDGLGRTPDFYNRVKDLYGKIKTTYNKTQPKRALEIAKDEFESLKEAINQVLSTADSSEDATIAPIDWDCIDKTAQESINLARDCLQKLENVRGKEKITSREKQKSYKQPEDYGYERYHINELIKALIALKDFARSSEASLSIVPALLIVGDAGTGKTHLFCDVAKQRISSGFPTVLLLGGNFSKDEPWSQIIKLLGLPCTKEDFLGALEAAAQARGARALILIDALNEGEGRNIWHKHLAGMLTTLSRYPWIGIAVSVRASYESTVIPEELSSDRLIREVHLGFADHEYQATKTFFDHYGIVRPSIPLLVPEFQNPLFLKLFCMGLKNRGLTKVPPGLRGITAVFNFFIESVNEKLSKPEYLDFDPKSQAVQRAVEKLAETMADKGSLWLPREEAQDTVNTFLPREGYENSLFRHMLSEGLLAEDRFRVGDQEWCESIHFAYERFADHLIAKHLLDKYLDPEHPLDSFQPDQPLGSFVRDEWTCWRNRGLIEAFSIQIPEMIKEELPELAPYCADYLPIREAFIESLIWRDPKAITDATLDYINKHIVRYEDTHDQFLNALLTVASNPDHPYNADFLHKNLIKFELPERDAWWSISLHYQYGEQGAVDRLVDWAWSPEDKSHINDESIRLCAIALAWFLTTSNRYLRDRATKALVSLLTKRIHVLRQVIREFLDVNDPYVLERLFAVAYGCAIRSMDNNAIAELAKDIYEWIFKDGTPPPHILLRDYARGVIELALHRRIKLSINVEKIRPPYKSEWPSFEIPTEKELKRYGEWQEGMPDEEWARVALYNSVMGFRDFARYIIGTNSGHFNCSSRRLNEPRKPSRKEIYEDFVKSLTDSQRKAWERYYTKRLNVEFYRRLDKADRGEIFKREIAEEEFDYAIASTEQSFRKTLGKKKLKVFEDYVLPYLNNPDPYKDEYRFDLSVAQRWIFKRVLDLGWTVERFGRFDRNIKRYSYGREANKPERIGKKYQWIAYHEFLARVSDNFEFKGDSWSNGVEKYEGPWQIGYIRDIDPSCLLKKTERQEWQPHQNTWWFPSSYNAWDSEPDDVKWLRNSEDLPAIEPLIEVTNPEDGLRWLVLEAIYRWEQPTPPGKERYEIPRREIWYMIKSYIVKKSDIDELFDWAKKQNFMGRWMPESHETTRVFLGEFFWAPAFVYHNIPYFHHEGWTRGYDNRIPKEVLVTTDQYMQEGSGYDRSIDETIKIYLPAKWIVDNMCLRWKGVEGHFYDNQGNLIAFDPSVRFPGPGALLINRDVFLKFLNDNDYDLLWTILGEKNIIGGRLSHEDWKGRLQLTGTYRIHQHNLDGVVNAKFIS